MSGQQPLRAASAAPARVPTPNAIRVKSTQPARLRNRAMEIG
jgi:hypothetical protein